MILYHGTTDRHLPTILKNGIQPRGKQRSNWKSAPSRNDCVYLTNAYPAYFAYSATKVDSEEQLLILEVNVSPLFLLPDEDWLEQVTRKQPGLAPADKSMGVRTAWYRRRLESFQSHAPDSLAGIGNAAHKGEIGRTQIRRYATMPFETYAQMTLCGHDPSISVQNYHFVGDRYRAWVKWMFDEGEFPHPQVPEKYRPDRNTIKVVTL